VTHADVRDGGRARQTCSPREGAGRARATPWRPRPGLTVVAAAVALTLLSGLAGAAEDAAAPTWRAGVASVVITPDVPIWMAGYAARTKPADGKLQDLHAKALALEDPDGRRAVLVTTDLVGIPRDVASEVCEAIGGRHGLAREAVLLSASHTHSGPVVGSNLRPAHRIDEANRKLVDTYTAVLKDRLVEVAAAALAGLAPADIAWGTGQVTFAVNRRENPEAEVPNRRALGRLVGPVDHDVPTLAVRAKDGTLRAVLFGYACHATVLDGYEWSGDYPGFAQQAVESSRPGTTALFFAGCGADQNPLPRRSVALAEKYGRSLAAGVEAVLDAPMTPVEGSFAAAYAEVPLPFGDLPTREHLTEAAAGSNAYEAARAELLLKRLDEEGRLPADYPYPVQAWRLGGLTCVALGGEVVVDYALRIKRELDPAPIWVAGYANDVMAYIPSERVLREGGYEGGEAMVYYGLPSAWAPGVEDRIVAAVHGVADKVRGEPVPGTGAAR